jgi:hypothetical protein
MNFTVQQKLNIGIGIIGAATAAFGALNSIMTPTQALIGTVILGFISACLGVINTVLTSTTAQIKTVTDMPGVDKIVVNAKATNGIAAAAVDPAQPKVGGSSPEVQTTLINKAL